MGVLNQIIATTIVCFPCLNMGVMYAWPSSTVLQFTSPNTSLHRPMTDLEVNFFGSLSSGGAMLGTMVAAWGLDRIGRKRCCIISGMMNVISWAIIAFTTRVEVILVAVFMSGFSGSSFLIVPVYVGEFCQESLRGTMASCSMVFYGVGTLISYVLGGYFSYNQMIYIAMSLAVLELIMMSWLKESPVYLMNNGLNERAAKSIAFYRRVESNSKIVLEELNLIRKALKPTVVHELIPDEDKTGVKIDLEKYEPMKDIEMFTYIDVTAKVPVLRFLMTSRPTRRGLLISMGLMTAAMCQGLVVVQVYAEPLFMDAVPDMSSTLCTVLFAVSIVVASFAAAYLSDIVGRRPLMTYSSIASALCCVLLGAQLQVGWGPSWMTAAIMYLFCAVYSFGGGTVPFVLLAEVFLIEVKSFMIMLVVEWMWLCSFFTLVVFNPLVSAIGLGPLFYIFGFICITSAVFSIFYVPETKGLTLEAVQSLLTARKCY